MRLLLAARAAVARAGHLTRAASAPRRRRQQKEKEQKKADEKAAELARIEANRQNEARQWAEFKALNERIAAMEQRLGALQEAQAQEREGELKVRAPTAESGRNKGWFR